MNNVWNAILTAFMLFLFLALAFVIYVIWKTWKAEAKQELICDFSGVFPNIIPPILSTVENDEEKLIKVFPISTLRSRFLRMRKADGALILTNKRLIYRTIGYFGNHEFIHSEVPVEDVASVHIQRGVIFDALAFAMNYGLFGGSLVGIVGLTGMADIFGLLSPVIFIGACIAFRRSFKAYNAFLVDRGMQKEPFWTCIKNIFWPLKMQLTVNILSKGGASSAVNIGVLNEWGRLDISSTEEPLDNMDGVDDELGKIIYELQKYGTVQGKV